VSREPSRGFGDEHLWLLARVACRGACAVFVARAAMAAAASRNVLQAIRAARNPPVRAEGRLACAAIRWPVRLIAIAHDEAGEQVGARV
jgi:hypothetical protein